jgi:hypothetical protein
MFEISGGPAEAAEGGAPEIDELYWWRPGGGGEDGMFTGGRWRDGCGWCEPGSPESPGAGAEDDADPSLVLRM